MKRESMDRTTYLEWVAERRMLIRELHRIARRINELGEILELFKDIEKRD